MEKLKQCKYQIAGGVLAILLILWYNNSYQRLQGEYSILQAQYAAQKENVKLLDDFRKKEKDSLSKAITLREKENEKLVLQNNSIQSKIEAIKKRVIKIPTDLRSSVEYYNTGYKTAENKVVEDKVGLGLSTSTAVIADLQKGFKCFEISVLKDEQLKNKDSAIGNLEKDKKDLSVLVFTSEKQIEASKTLQKSAEENINNLRKQNKKQKIINKLLVPVALVAGGFIGVQIAK